MARHRRTVIAAWIAAAIACAFGYSLLQSRLAAPDYGVSGSQSARATTLTQRHFDRYGAEQDAVVFHAVRGSITASAARAAVAQALAAVRGSDGVATVTGPFSPGAHGQVSADRRSALAIVALRGDANARASHAAAIQAALQRTTPAQGPVRAWLTGYSPITDDLNNLEQADIERAEAIGVPVAFVVLVFALGAVAAALVPLVLALAGLLATFGGVALFSLAVDFDTFAITIVTMIAIGIGIDYSLLVVSRFREELARHAVTDPGDARRERAVTAAADIAVATAGRTILASGALLAATMCSLLIVDSPVFREVSIGVVVAVLGVLSAALTLLPALLAALGPRLDHWALPARWRPADVTPGRTAGGGWARWARLVMRHPVALGAPVAALLLAAALPLGALRYGIDLGARSLGDQPTAQAQRVLQTSFAPGVVSPIQVVVTGSGGRTLDAAGARAARTLAAMLRDDQRVAQVETVAADGSALLLVVPSVPIDSNAATNLVHRIRHAPHPRTVAVAVGGATAQFSDLADEITAKLPYVLATVLAITALVLLVAFRSLLLPIKAVAMNLLASAAGVGLTVAVFQSGHGAGTLGFTSTGFLQAYLPITVFVVLFGLSMDYELFLLRRMQETWQRTRDNSTAIAVGIQHTARPITAAAAIMVAVFGGFLTADVLELGQFGFALATAIALDATLVRLVLVPACMRLLGDLNWWLPTLSPHPRRAARRR